MSNSPPIVILHAAADARHCVEHGLHRHGAIYSTYAGLEVYLAERYGVACTCLSRFLSTEDALGLKERASRVVDSVLDSLDATVSREIARSTGWDMRWFRALYSYIGKYHLLAYMSLAEAVRRLRTRHHGARLHVYNFKFNRYLDTSSDMDRFLSACFPDLPAEIVSPPGNAPARQGRDWHTDRAQPILRRILRRTLVPWHTHFRRPRIVSGRPSVLLIQPLYQMEFLLRELTDFNAVVWRENGFPEKEGGAPTGSASQLTWNTDTLPSADPCCSLFLQDIQEDFAKQFPRSVRQISAVAAQHKNTPFSVAVWGNSPCEGMRAVLTEYLRSIGVPVVGGQHGNVYGDSYEPWHFDSDFNRCDVFLTFGFTECDLKNLYPDRQIRTRVVPVGYLNKVHAVRRRKPVDLVFPLTNSYALVAEGMNRLLPHDLVDRQRSLLSFLGSVPSATVVVKPVCHPCIDTCPTLPIFEKMRNLRVISDITFVEFLRTHAPNAVLLDFPGMPLFEAIRLDAELLVMDDPIHPFSPHALDLLKKRAYYTADLSEMVGFLALFFEGRLEKKRDDSFARHYVRDGNTRRLILDLLRHCVQGAR